MGSAQQEDNWSYEPVQATIERDGRLFDVQIPARHPLVSGGKRPVRGAVFNSDESSEDPKASRPGLTKARRTLGVTGSAADRAARRRKGPRRRPDHRGRVTVIRQPETVRPQPAPLDADVDIPPIPKDPVPVPWGTMIPSLAGGAVIAYLFSPMFAILAGVTAVGMLGRSVASFVTHRRKTAARNEAMQDATVHVEVARSLWAASEADRRTQLDRAVLELLEGGLAQGVMPWSRRMETDGSLEACLGIGREFVSPALSSELAQTVGDVPELLALASSPLLLPSAPVYRSITSTGGLAVSGDRGPALDLARHVLMSQQVEFGPADLGIALITTEDRLRDWDWLKWLPSFFGAAISSEEVELLLEPFGQSEWSSILQQAQAVRPVLLVVDGVEPSGPGLFAKAFAGRLSSVRLLCVAEAFEAPAACSNHVEARADATFVAHNLLDPSERPQTGALRVLHANRVGSLARLLAPFDDPELDDAGASLPVRISHEALYTHVIGDADSDAADSDAVANWLAVLEDRWSTAQRNQLTSTLGLDRNGPVSLDLVADGPHMLAAGTTGSGKSEMLRSLIVGAAINHPPDHVSFLLVDFKGGGAFDLVSGLPHVAAVVTDLDPSESGRALQSLQAEMKSREEVLRANECSDIADLRGDATLPRLVIVVDEFASLADELPEFLDGLIDVARRGRSLGVHLVLATQRPAGVVTGQIRANTNLRVCLRVQDHADSMDVLDGPEAARLPAVPGRAIISRGGAKPVMIQCVKVEPDDANKLAPFVIHPAMVASVAFGDAASAAEGTIDDDDPMADLVAACARLAPTKNAAPWLDPIRHVDLGEVRSALVVAEQGESVPLGWLDDPDNRARVPFGWAPSRGALAIIGSDGDVIEASVRTSIAGLVAQGAAHVYVLDGGGTLGDLEPLLALGCVVGINDPERAAKVLTYIGEQLGTHESTRSAAVLGLIVHRWGAVVDMLESVNGAMAGAELQKLLRDGADRGLAAVVSASSDREIPNRVMSSVGQRVIHRLADSSGYLSFGLGRNNAIEGLAGSAFVDPASGLAGLVARAEPADASDSELVEAPSIRVLGDRVARAELPVPIVTKRSVSAPLGFGSDLETVSISLRPGQPIIVVGRSGSGRTTAIETLVGQLAPDVAARVEILDDAELIDPEEARSRLEEAKKHGRAVIVGAKPATTRGIGSWLAPLMSEATVVLINPSKADSDACRILAPDLAGAARGRAIVSDGSSSTVVQIAA